MVRHTSIIAPGLRVPCGSPKLIAATVLLVLRTQPAHAERPSNSAFGIGPSRSDWRSTNGNTLGTHSEVPIDAASMREARVAAHDARQKSLGGVEDPESAKPVGDGVTPQKAEADQTAQLLAFRRDLLQEQKAWSKEKWAEEDRKERHKYFNWTKHEDNEPGIGTDFDHEAFNEWDLSNVSHPDLGYPKLNAKVDDLNNQIEGWASKVIGVKGLDAKAKHAVNETGYIKRLTRSEVELMNRINRLRVHFNNKEKEELIHELKKDAHQLQDRDYYNDLVRAAQTLKDMHKDQSAGDMQIEGAPGLQPGNVATADQESSAKTEGDAEHHLLDTIKEIKGSTDEEGVEIVDSLLHESKHANEEEDDGADAVSANFMAHNAF